MRDLFLERRSIRRFTGEVVEQEKLNQILEAARWAPSWGNQQCCEIIAIRDAGINGQLAALLSTKNPATKCLQGASVVLAICGDPLKSGYYKEKQVTRYEHWFLYDLGLVSQNISLKAHELGLGSVIVGSFNHQETEQLLNIPNHLQLVALIPLGYPDHSPSPPKRKSLEELIHQDTYSQKA